MFEYMYEWLRNLAFYLILVTAVTYILPGNGYRKYIRFFTGLVLILMLVTPLFQLFGIEHKTTEFYKGYDFEETMKEIEGEIYTDSNVRIEVEEIVIGP